MRWPTRSPRKIVVVGAAGALLLAACTSIDDGGDGAVDEGADDETAEPATLDEADEDAVLRYSSGAGVSNMDPHLASSSEANTWLWPVYDRLVHLTPEGEAEPGLAEDWEFNEEVDELTLYLRDGVTFHDGERFDGDAVAANIERGQTEEGSAVAGLLGVIEEVEVVDDQEVVLHLARPDASLPLVLSDRPGAMISPAAFNEDLNAQPVGAGMFEVVEHEQDHRLVLERYDDYWDPEAVLVQGLELYVMADESARLNAVRTGDLDIARVSDPSLVESLAQEGLTIDVAETLQLGTMQVNSNRHPEFEDPLVRQAILHAIDREGIVEGVLDGHGTPTIQPFPQDYFAGNADIGHDHHEHDPELARELLEEADYPHGFSFELASSTSATSSRTAEVIADQLRDVGLDVQLRRLESAELVERFYAEQDIGSVFLDWGGRPDPATTIDLLYTGDSFNNPSDMTTDEIESLNEEAVAAADEQERAEVLQELSAVLADDPQSLMPIFHIDRIYATSEDVVGWQAWLSARPEFRGVAIADQ